MGSKYEPQPPTQSGKSSKEAERGLDDGVESVETVDVRMRRMADGHAAQLHREAEKARQDDLIPFKPVTSRKRQTEKAAGQTPAKGSASIDPDTGRHLTDTERRKQALRKVSQRDTGKTSELLAKLLVCEHGRHPASLELANVLFYLFIDNGHQQLSNTFGRT